MVSHNNTRITSKSAMMVFLLMLLLYLPCHRAVAQSSLRYQMSITGISDRDILSILGRVSKTKRLADRPPSSLKFLDERIKEDIVQFRKVMRSFGYYDSVINSEVITNQAPIQIIFHIRSGEPYHVDSVALDVLRKEPETQFLPETEDYHLAKGDVFQPKNVLELEKAVVDSYRRHGHPFVMIKKRQIVIDRAAKTASITLVIDPGPQARFGAVTFHGLKTVKEDFLLSKIPWKTGDIYNSDLLDEAKTKLAKTDLFSIVVINHADRLDKHNRLPITVEVVERKHRTVRAGIRYDTDNGASIKVSWLHRNIFHGGEKLSFKGEASTQLRSLLGSFTEPCFVRNDQLLGARLEFADETTDAYDSTRVDGEMIVERYWNDKLHMGVGIGYRLSRVEQQGVIEDYSLFKIPAYLTWDASNDQMDPSSGFRIRAELRTYLGTHGRATNFFKTYLAYTHYLSLIRDPPLVLATRLGIGSITGCSRDNVPADLRFYAGGGGSIRGYPYQKVGPLVDGDPIGGNSIVELSSEFRLRAWKSVGLVAFLEGGNVFEESYPSFNSSLRWAVGSGVRYYTPVGPFRVDFAVPINRRKGVDDAFQIYISFGHAF